jgi:selenocysteine lyase/cysteine desulfurase
MSSSMSTSRRQFLTGVGGLALAGTGYLGGRVSVASASTEALPPYLFEPGLTYLNTAAMGPTSRHVLERTMEAWYELESNPTAKGYTGYAEDSPIWTAERVPQQGATLLGCHPEEMTVTRSTTEGMNVIAEGLGLGRGDRVLSSDQEHEGGTVCWQYSARRHGAVLDTVQVPLGNFDVGSIVERFESAIRPETRVISVSHVLTSTGLRMPIAELATLAATRDIILVVDGAQAVGGMAVNVKELGCHAYATSGHKWLLGPKGTGLLYISAELGSAIQPVHLEGGPLVQSPSTGVANIPAVIGLGVAIEQLQLAGAIAVEAKVIDLRNRIYQGMLDIPKIRVVSPPPGPLATALVSCVLPPEYESRAFQRMVLDKHHIMIKRVEGKWFNGIRLSPHVFNTEDEVDHALDVLRAELV